MISGTVVSRSSESTEVPLFDAVGCLCLWGDRILFLQRADDRSYPSVWGLPSGKVEPNETRDRAVMRELYEETGLLRSAANLEHIDDFHVKNDDFTFLYAVFSTRYTSQPSIHLKPNEHTQYRWVAFDDAMTLPLVPGTRECLAATRSKIFPPTQLSLFDVDDNLLADAMYAEQEQLEKLTAASFPTETIARSSPTIVVIGPPAAGKTTLIRNVVERRAEIAYHRHDDMKDKGSRQYMYLTRFLSGDTSYAFLCQIEALTSRYWHGRLVTSGTVLADEWIFSTLAYTKALRYRKCLTDYEFQTFYMTYLAYLQWLPPPSLVVHVTANPDVLRKRIEARGRKMEQVSHTIGYLAALKQGFDEVAEEVGTKYPLVCIDTSELSRSTSTNKLLDLIDDHKPRSPLG